MLKVVHIHPHIVQITKRQGLWLMELSFLYRPEMHDVEIANLLKYLQEAGSQALVIPVPTRVRILPSIIESLHMQLSR